MFRVEQCASGRVQEVMVIVPVDRNVNEAQDIAEEHREHRSQGCNISSVRRLHLQHHDRDDDGKYPIAESFQSALIHFAST